MPTGANWNQRVPIRRPSAADKQGSRTCTSGICVARECDLHGYGDPDDLRVLAWRLVGPQFAAHLDAQATWPARTDSDRLTDAFRALDVAGIVAREDFTCCQGCGASEIGDEALDPAAVRGYAFYHGQDAERAAAGGGLWMSYGSFGQPTTVDLGEEVVAALRAEGLQVDWDGSPERRIQVRLCWARRRHGRLAAFAPYDPAEPDVAVTVTGG